MIHPEYLRMNAGVGLSGLNTDCASQPGTDRPQTLHQVRARKKKEKIISGHPTTQLRVRPIFFSGAAGPNTSATSTRAKQSPTSAFGSSG